MNNETHTLVIIYVIYILMMTILDTMSYEFALKNKLGYFILLSSYISTSAYLVLFSTSDILLSLSIVVYFWLITQIAYNLGKYNFSIVSLVIFQELLMSLLYYTIVSGNLSYALSSLYFYGTDIPSLSLPLTQIIVPAILEVVNSFMFFLMVFPEVVYLSLRFKNYDLLLLSVLIFTGPNIASEMTHSILPLPYDPIREFSILELILSIFITIYFSYKYIKGKMNLTHYLIFIVASISLSLSDLYYSLTVNEIPYALTTLVLVGLVFYTIPRTSGGTTKRINYLAIIPSFSQLFFGASVAYFYNLVSLTYAISLFSFLASFFPIFYYYHKTY